LDEHEPAGNRGQGHVDAHLPKGRDRDHGTKPKRNGFRHRKGLPDFCKQSDQSGHAYDQA
jgi:hypothetical protein